MFHLWKWFRHIDWKENGMATFVLVHGTTAGGWVWKGITPHLEAAGHVVYRPTLTGLGERVHLLTREVGLSTHITDIVNVLEFEDLTDVVLVGHSYGGMVITGVADAVPKRIRELVYLDAAVPRDGESLLDLMGDAARIHNQATVESQGDGWLIPVQRGPNDVGTKNTPHPWKSWAEPIRLSNPPAAIPRTYVRFTADKKPGQAFFGTLDENWRRAQEGGMRLRELDTVHQIIPDPMPKLAVLLELFPG